MLVQEVGRTIDSLSWGVVLPETLTYYRMGRSYADCAEPVPGPTPVMTQIGCCCDISFSIASVARHDACAAGGQNAVRQFRVVDGAR